MKFKSNEDVQSFLFDLSISDLPEDLDHSTFQPTNAQLLEFIKRRKSLVKKLKDFRKSQSTKRSWRKNRYKFMKGIKSFHKSTQGKRFHRNLGRFLSLRQLKSEALGPDNVLEALKAVNSLKTHLIIELEYYKPLEEEVAYSIFIEELFPVIDTLSANLITYNTDIDSDDLELLLRVIPPEDLANSVVYSRLLTEELQFDTESEFRESVKSSWSSSYLSQFDTSLIGPYNTMITENSN